MHFLDIEKAFDNKVWYEGLLYKIKQKFPTSQHNLVKSCLEDWSFFVKNQNSISDVYNIVAGLPQGSVLGLVLYTLDCIKI